MRNDKPVIYLHGCATASCWVGKPGRVLLALTLPQLKAVLWHHRHHTCHWLTEPYTTTFG